MPPKRALSPKKTPSPDDGTGSPKASPTKKVVKKVVKRASSPAGSAASAPAPAPPTAAASTAATPPAKTTAKKALAPKAKASAAASPAGSVEASPEASLAASPEASPPTSPGPKAPGKTTGKKLMKKAVAKPAGAAPSPPADTMDDIVIEADAPPSPPASKAKLLLKKAVNMTIAANKFTAASKGLLAPPPRSGLFITEVTPNVHNAPQQHEVVDQPESLVTTVLDAKAAEHRIRFEGLKRTIEVFYGTVAPDRANKAAEVARKYLGDELRLFAQLEAKYRFGATVKERRRKSAASSVAAMPTGKAAIPPPPVYPPGYLQKEFHKNITAAAIAQACRDQLVGNKLKEQRLVQNRAKAALAANPSAPQPPKAKTRDTIAKEVEGLVDSMPTDMQVNEMVRLAGLPLEKATTPSAQALYGFSVWADVAVRTHALAKVEKEWDDRVTDYLKNRAEAALGGGGGGSGKDGPLGAFLASAGSAGRASIMGGGLDLSRSPSISGLPPLHEFGADPFLDGGSVGPSESIAPTNYGAPTTVVNGEGVLVDPHDPLGLGLGTAGPSLAQQQDTVLWQLIHEHHQRVRRSLFNGEVVMDEVLPTGEAAVRAAAGAPPTVPASVLHACIGAGYASTCDVTYRQQLQAFVLKYCPQNMPLIMPALWLYRGREHELIAKLHAEHGLDKPPAPEGGARPPPPPPAAVKGPLPEYLCTAPNTINSFPDPLVGSEVYLSEVMHGTVCGIGREVEYDTRFRLMKEGLEEDEQRRAAEEKKIAAAAGKKIGKPRPPIGGGGNSASMRSPTETTVSSFSGAAGPKSTAVPPCAYPCEDASFRSWSNIPPALHPTAHMARHFGLGPQFVHQLHAQNPLNPEACGFELLCTLFPDAVYFCLDDDEQRLAFMTKRVSELMSFVQVCDPTFTRPHRGLPEGSGGSGQNMTLMDTIPRLFQKYSGLRGTLTDEQHERQAELDRIALNTASKYTRKPSKNFKGTEASNDDDAMDDSGEFGYRNRPERALADVFTQHFKKQLESVEMESFPWEDLYKHISNERHQQVLGHCQRWASAYGPLPPVNAIQLDIIGAATAAVHSRPATRSVGIGGGSDDDGDDVDGLGLGDDGVDNMSSLTQRMASLKPTTPDFPESGGTTAHLPTTLADPFAPTLSLLGVNTAALTPSLLHRMACQQLTRSTPTVHDSILKPWLRQTCEVGTMTRHREEEILGKMLNTRSVGTSVTEDGINLGDDKYHGWPIPFRYEEEYRQAVSKMSLPQLRRERHRALFGGRGDVGVQLFGNKGRPMGPPPTQQQHYGGGGGLSPSRGHQQHHRSHHDDPNGGSPPYGAHRGTSPSVRGGGGRNGGVRIAADGTIDLSSSPSLSPTNRQGCPSASPSRVGAARHSPSPPHHHRRGGGGGGGGGAPPPPTAKDVASLYRFQKDYEQWFEENVGESGRGRFDYKKQIDPDREARRRHRELYFGVPARLDDSDSDDDDGYNHSKLAGEGDDALMDAVFGDPSKANNHRQRRMMGGEGPASRALAVAESNKSPYWFDHDAGDYADETDEWLAARTSGEGVVGLIRRYRANQQLLAGATREIDALRAEVDGLRDAASGTMLTVPRLTFDAEDGGGGVAAAYPRTFVSANAYLDNSAAAATAAHHRRAGGGPCSHCEGLQSKVNTLLDRLSALRGNVGSPTAKAARADASAVDETDLVAAVFGSEGESSVEKGSLASPSPQSHRRPTANAAGGGTRLFSQETIDTDGRTPSKANQQRQLSPDSLMGEADLLDLL